MAQVGYTNTDQIRAVLGVTDKELGDTMILNLGVADQLTLALAQVYPDHAALKAAIDAETATAEEVLIWTTLTLYARYEAACALLPQFQMIVVKRISDGDVEMQRFGPDDLAQFREEIRGKRDDLIRQLDPDYFGTEPFSQFGAVVPNYDPVTNVTGGV
jgi:hypothetical protein